MAARLVYTHAGRRSERPLQGTRVTVGRDKANDIVIEDEGRSLSRFHARFDFDGTHWRIVDTKSRNRVSVNGKLIDPEEKGAQVLADGDSIMLGGFNLRFIREEAERMVLETERRAPGQTSETYTTVSPVDLSGLIGSSANLPKAAQAAVERAKRVLSVVTTLSQRIAAVTPIDDIIDAIVDLVFETTPALRAGLLLWDEDVGRLVPKSARGRDGSDAGTMRVSESLVQKAFSERVTVQMDPKVPSGSMADLRLRSAIAVPLVDDAKSIGVIYADTSLLAEAFDVFGVSLLSALANHAAMALEQARLLRRVRQEERARTRLERYLARGVVDRILASGETNPGFSMRAEEAEVTVLFCDMAGFTTRTESLAPQDVLFLLNRYFGNMTEVILGHEGTLDKYIGDCIMAVFGAPQAQPDHARRAGLAALGMRDAIHKMNEGQPEEKKVEFRMGIHSGRVIAGDVGHVARRDWTVLGATVNLASRMESSVASRDQIAVTGATRAMLGDEFETRPIVLAKLPKGISKDFQAFELLGLRKA
jgi:adenylate cyclase